ncbi:LysE/ArgO family amino acid transporter [Micrococcus terreus]|uniref:LysE/ArgO family amino acid transporter n=1 Tax=Micrococcus terreus TaxID=574650 RepID=UPI0023F978DA|nr:LysE family transporter [Micrococcus terreus]
MTPFLTVFLTGLLTCLALSVAIGAQSAFVLRQAIRREHLAAVLAVCIAGDTVLIFAGTAGVGMVTERAPWLLELLRWGGAAYLLWFAISSFRSAFTTQRLTLDTEDLPDDDATSGPHTTSPQAPLAPALTDIVDRASDSTPSHDPHPPTGSIALATRPTTSTLPIVSAPALAPARRTPTRAAAPLLRVLLTAFAVSWVNPQAIVDTTVMLGSLAASFGPDRWAYAAGAVIGSTIWLLSLGLGARALAPVLNTPRTWKVIDIVVGCAMVVVAGTLLLG